MCQHYFVTPCRDQGMQETARENLERSLLKQQEEARLDSFLLQQILLEEQSWTVLCAEPEKENDNCN